MPKIIYASTTGPAVAIDRDTGAPVPLDEQCTLCGDTHDQGAPHDCKGTSDGGA